VTEDEVNLKRGKTMVSPEGQLDDSKS
jgi:hypothetical protein